MSEPIPSDPQPAELSVDVAAGALVTVRALGDVTAYPADPQEGTPS